MSIKFIRLSQIQREKLEKLWFVFGNNGRKFTQHNHYFIQRLLDSSEDHRDIFLSARNAYEKNPQDYRPETKDNLITDECIKKVDQILNFSEKI